MKRFADLFAAHRWFVAAFVIAITGVAVWGNHFPPDWRSGRSNEDLDAQEWDFFRQVEREFGAGGSGCFLVIESNTLFTPPTMQAVRRIATETAALDFVAAVIGLDQVPTFDAFGIPGRLIPRDLTNAGALRKARATALEHPLVVGQLLSPDARTLLLPVILDWRRIESQSEAMSEIRSAAQATVRGQDVRVRLTGRTPLFVEQHEAFERANDRTQLIAYGLVIVLAALLFRSLAAVIIVSGAPFLGVYWSVGLLSLAGEEMNELTEIILPVLVTMVGFTDGVHLMVDVRRARAAGVDRIEAARGAIEHLGVACGLTSLTTAIGFASLMLAESEIIQDFGRDCAIGVFITFVAVVTVLPLLSTTRLGKNVHRGHEHDLVSRNLSLFSGLIDAVIHYRRTVSLAGITVACALAAIGFSLRPNNMLRSDFPPQSESYQALAHCDRAFGGIQMIYIAVDWSGAAKTADTRAVELIEEIESLIAGEPMVRSPMSILNVLSVLPGPSEDLTGRLPLTKLLPQDFVESLYHADGDRAIVLSRVQDLGIAGYEPVYDRLDAQLAELAEQYPGVKLELTGQPVVGGRQMQRIILDLAKSLGTAALVIFAVMGLAYRSLRIGLICIVPNMFPLAVTAALIVWMGKDLEITSVCAFTICLGIAVDDTIHFLSRFQRELAAGCDVDNAIRRSFIGVGTALIMTTIVLVCGFASVLASELPGHRLFAAMACSTILAALIGDLVILPAMLAWLVPSKQEQVDEKVPEEAAVHSA